tara:strand:- start:247 stop:873 length:627 start_codon:yes stop_codon:yes gene_type:complete
MFGFFRRKKDVEKLKQEVQESFKHVKNDFNKVGEWIQHIDGKHSVHEEDVLSIKEQLSSIQLDLDEVKDFISFFGPQISGGLSKQAQTSVQKQTAVGVVQTPVQTAVQTGILDSLTVMERAIIWALINSGEDMKLSYDDLAALLGKNKSTIRGQINGLKQKSEGLIEETRESNGKKRLFIPEKMRQFIVKSVKVRVSNNKKSKKNKGK